MRRDAALALLSRDREALRRFGVRSLALFGSVARDEAGERSDVDLLVEFEEPVGLFEFLALKEHLECVLGCPVDLVTPAALRPHMREHVLFEAIRAA